MNTDELRGDGGETGAVYPHQELTHAVIGAAMTVHNELGNGFLEKVYENAMAVELRSRGIGVAAQVSIEVTYKGAPVGNYVADMVVAGKVLCELKALDQLTTIHQSQVLHYLKATGLPVGLLINFGTERLQVKRLVR